MPPPWLQACAGLLMDSATFREQPYISVVRKDKNIPIAHFLRKCIVPHAVLEAVLSLLLLRKNHEMYCVPIM